MKKVLKILSTFLFVVIACYSLVACELGGGITEQAKEATYTVEIYVESTNGTKEDLTDEYKDELGECKGLVGETVDVRKYAIQFVPTGCELNSQQSVLSGVLSADKELVLRIEYKRKTYQVSFDVKGLVTQTVKHGALAFEPTAPQKNGFAFNGWLLYNEPFDFTTPVTHNIELSASWRSVYTPMTENDDYSQSVFGAGMEDQEGNVAVAVRSDDYIENGLIYDLSGSGKIYNLYLPVVDYTKYEKVTFEWKCSLYLGCGTDAGQWNSFSTGDGQYGTVEITYNAGKLVVVMYHPEIEGWAGHISYIMHVGNVDIINGHVPIALHGRTYGPYCWFALGEPTFTPKSA